MTTVAIIQARMTGSRLPNKVLLHLNGYPIIEWVYRRVKKSESITFPSRSKSISAVKVNLFTFGLRLQVLFDNSKGSIGMTPPGK